MAELVKQILQLSKAERLKIAMQILLSIQDEEAGGDQQHKEALDTFQQKLAKGEVNYLGEADFWTEVRKRVS